VTEFILLIPLLVLACVSWQLIRDDFREHRLPNKYTVPMIAITAASLVTYGFLTDQFLRIGQSLLAMAITFGMGWLLARYADLGMGDVKLLVSLNGWLAWHDPWLIAISLAVGLIAANLFALGIWLKRKDPKEHIALGPFLLLGFYLSAITPSWAIFTAVGESLA
jgi:leader peptidase (prepilin peptidase) / N-methyltransferase